MKSQNLDDNRRMNNWNWKVIWANTNKIKVEYKKEENTKSNKNLFDKKL